MIFYFSATGNDEYVASRIAAVTGERLCSITDCMHDERFSFELEDGERLGLVTPTYFWSVPSIVREFIGRLDITVTPDTYVFHVLTYGVMAGTGHPMVSYGLQRKGIHVQARFGISMVDTWTPLFDVSDRARNEWKNQAAEPVICEVCDKIGARMPTGGGVHRVVTDFAWAPWYLIYGLMRRTRGFKVEDTCVSCGKCATNCPTGAIEIHDGKPIWVKDRCTLCLGCLHRCPVFAIRYGHNTVRHGQYTNPRSSIR